MGVYGGGRKKKKEIMKEGEGRWGGINGRGREGLSSFIPILFILINN